ncbi:MAG: DUF975 family protein [Defluviitaleaceae bacterium]|nr:DUF975 family protein [Defluviitaleaceae bacterium]
MKSRQEIKALAKDAMGQQRSTAILLGLVYMAVTFASGVLDGIVETISGGMGIAYWIVFTIGMLIIIVMAVNMLGEYIKIFNRDEASVGAMFSGLGVNFARKLGGVLWMSLFVTLWTLLLIIPGIIKGLSYYFTSNILADCPDVKATDAIKISMRITKDHKIDIFIFVLSFLGWFILSALTLGILYIVYVGPYFYTADAGLYLELKNKALAEGRITQEELNGHPLS